MTEIRPENTTVEQKQAPAEPKVVIGPGNASKAKFGYWWGTGRRKTSVARVRIRPGTGKLIVNKKDLETYFTKDQDRKAVVAPLKIVQTCSSTSKAAAQPARPARPCWASPGL